MKRGAILSFATFALFALLVGTLSYAAHLGIGSRTCDWRDARAGYFLAYCSAPAFGDYEHAAHFLDLEPNATKHLEKAQVIFLGNSRAEMAFSTVATQDFFRAHPVPYYVLGFGYDEKSEFALKVLRKFRPPIKLLVINTDPFFEPGWLSPAAKGADLSVKAYVAHFTKKIVAPLQQAFCRAMAEWCMPRSMSLYRAEANGMWNTIDAFQDFARGKPGQHELKDISSPALRALANASAFVADIESTRSALCSHTSLMIVLMDPRWRDTSRRRSVPRSCSHRLPTSKLTTVFICARKAQSVGRRLFL